MLSFDSTASAVYSRFNNLFASRGGQTAQTLLQFSVRTQTQTGLLIVTAEGDKVTLSTNTAIQGTGIRYNARGVLEGQALTLRANSLESEWISQKQVTIEGDLNEQEIQEIKKIIQQVNSLTRDVTSGHVNAALAHGQQIAASGTLASIDVNIQHAESLSLNQAVERKGVTNTAQAGQQVTHGSEEGAGPASPQDHLLQGILASKFLSKPAYEEQGRSARVPHSNGGIPRSTDEPEESSLTQRVKGGLKQGVQGLVEYFKNIGEELLKGTEALAKLANRLKKAVAHQSARIAKAYDRLAEYLNTGATEKADRIQNTIDRRVDRLQNTVDKSLSRIKELVNNQAGKLTNILKSQAAEGQSREVSQTNETGAENGTTKTSSQNTSDKENKTVSS